MFIDSTTQRRVNIYAPYKGFSKLDTQEIRERAGVIEIPDPTPPVDYSEDLYYRTEQDDAPYVVYTRKSPEQITSVLSSKIKAKRDQITVDGGCLVQTKWFHTDAYSKQQQMALFIMGASIPAGLMWKTMDGSFIEMTQALAAELFATQVARESQIFYHAEALIAGMAGLDQTQLITYDINSGWPIKYEVII